MATFDDIEKSAEGGAPVMLIRVTVGDAPPSLFCDAEEDFVYAGQTFKALPLKTGSIKSDVMLQSNDVGVTLPRSDALFPVFWPNMPRKPSSIEIRQTHYGAEDAPLVFSGSIFSSSLDEERTSFTLNAKSSLYQINKIGSRRKWQTGCPFVVYGGKCRASAAASTFSGTIVYLANNRFRFTTPEYSVVDEGGNISSHYIRDLLRYRTVLSTPFDIKEGAENFWIGSTIQVGGYTFISGAYERPVGDYAAPNPVFKIADPAEAALMRSLVVGTDTPASVTPDCTRTIECCAGIHRNQRNYGGQPSLPYESPVGVSYIGDR